MVNVNECHGVTFLRSNRVTMEYDKSIYLNLHLRFYYLHDYSAIWVRRLDLDPKFLYFWHIHDIDIYNKSFVVKVGEYILSKKQIRKFFSGECSVS